MDGAHQYWFKKEKLRGPMRYPISQPGLDAALAQAGVRERVYGVRFLAGQREWPTLVEAELAPIGSRVQEFRSGRCMLTVWAVPGPSASAVAQLLATEGMPMLCAWLRESGEAELTWRSEPHGLRISLVDGVLVRTVR